MALALILAAAFTAIIQSKAIANQMTVFSCHAPNGAAVSSDGWTMARTVQAYMYITNTCAANNTGTMMLEVGSNPSGYPNQAGVAWIFMAPAWATIAKYTIDVADSYTYYSNSGIVGSAAIQANDETDPQYDYRNLGDGSQGPQTIERTPADTVTSIAVNAACDGEGGPCPAGTRIARMDFASSTLILNDSTIPSVSGLGGSMVSGSPLSGTAEASFTATDKGPGVYSAWLVVDGQAQPAVMLDTNNGMCVNLGQTDNTRSFSHPDPCAESVSSDIAFDTTTLPDGQHTIKLNVDDASGNTTTAYDATISTHNAPGVSTAPTISGIAAVGSTLSASNGTFSVPSGAGSLSAVTGQWLRCTSQDIPASCQAIPGADGATYTPASEDLRHTIVYQDTVGDSDGQTVSDSQPTVEISETGGSANSTSTTNNSSTTNNASTTSSSSNSEVLSSEALAIARGAANGSPASDQASLSVHWAAAAHASSVKTTYARQSRAIGRLVSSSGQPIAGALIQVLAVPSSPGLPSYSEGKVRTAGDGSFVFDTNARRSSRTLFFQYKSHVNDLSLAAQGQLSVAVPVPVSLKVSPHRVRRGSTIHMSGSVPGPIPAGGKQIVLQALAVGVHGAKWQTFNVIHTNSKGKFKASYRFRFAGPARYRIRAVSRFEQDYPYLASTSTTTLIKES